MLEELVHKQDGTIVSKDPYVHYATPGSRVILVDESLSASNSAHVRQGAIGWIEAWDADRNKSLLAYAPKDRRLYEICVTWSRDDLTEPGIAARPRTEKTVQYVMLPGAIKPHHD